MEDFDDLFPDNKEEQNIRKILKKITEKWQEEEDDGFFDIDLVEEIYRRIDAEEDENNGC